MLDAMTFVYMGAATVLIVAVLILADLVREQKIINQYDDSEEDE